MAHYQLMLPSKVTEIPDINILKNIYFPKLITSVPLGIRILITNNTALYYDELNRELVEIANTFVLTDLFVDICYQCDKYNCTIDAIVIPKKATINWLLYNFNKEKAADTISTSDVDVILTDVNLLSTPLTNFELRLDKLKHINEELALDYVTIAKYVLAHDITDLLTYVQSKFIINTRTSIHVRSISSMYGDSLLYSKTIETMTLYSPFIELRCNFVLKGILKAINDTVVQSNSYNYKGDFKFNIATSFDVLFNNSIIKISLGNTENDDYTTIRKLTVENKNNLIGKELFFTGFVINETDINPIGTTFLTFI